MYASFETGLSLSLKLCHWPGLQISMDTPISASHFAFPEITGMHHYAPLFPQVLGTQTQVLTLRRQSLYQLPHLPNLVSPLL